MSNVKLFLVLAFVMVCAAGAGVGMIVDQRMHPAVSSTERPHRGGPLDELKLTSEQREKMHAIWSPVQKKRDSRFHERHDLAVSRDQKILALLTPEQRAAYDEIQASYRDSVKQSEDALQKAVQNAEAETRAMLTSEQQAKYDEIRAKMGSPGNGRRGPGRNHTHPSTQPAASTQPFSPADSPR